VLLNEHSGLALDAPSAVAGGTVDQEAPDGGPAQHWSLESAGGSFYRFVSPAGLAVTAASGGSSVALAPLDCTSPAQEWTMAATPIANAVYKIVNHQTGWDVDVTGLSTKAAATVIQWPATNGLNQQWIFTPAPGGTFVLKNVNSALVLDVAAGGAEQEPASGVASQTWKLQPASAGYYTFTSGAGGLLESPSSNQGDALAVGAATGTASQEWMLMPVP
jgi:hypothetical protein